MCIGALAADVVGASGGFKFFLFFSIASICGVFLASYVWEPYIKTVALEASDFIADRRPR